MKMDIKGVAIRDHYNNNFFHSVEKLSWKEQIDAFLKGCRNAKDAAKQFDMDVF